MKHKMTNKLNINLPSDQKMAGDKSKELSDREIPEIIRKNAKTN